MVSTASEVICGHMRPSEAGNRPDMRYPDPDQTWYTNVTFHREFFRHGPVDPRGRCRLRGVLGQIWACGVCNYGLLNASSRMGIINIFLCAERGAGPGEEMRSKDSTTLR